MKANIGPNLLRLRTTARVTQTQLAELASAARYPIDPDHPEHPANSALGTDPITQSAIARWETGDRSPRHGITLWRLATALDHVTREVTYCDPARSERLSLVLVSDLLPGGAGCVTLDSLSIPGVAAELLEECGALESPITITDAEGRTVGRLGSVYEIAPEITSGRV